MALFFQLYYTLPKDDYRKTTLRSGNPHRFDHYILGITSIHGSLYKQPKNPDITQLWLWDDPAFDSMDPSPSEELLVKRIYDLISQEMERVLNDKQVSFPDHFLVGDQLQRQLGFLYSRAINYNITSEESLFHVILGAKTIDLSQIAVSHQTNNKTLKPVYLSSVMKNFDLKSFTPQKAIDSAFAKFEFDTIENHGRSDTLNLMKLYYQFLSS